MGTLIQDLRYGLRMLAKNPGFTAIAVITLALGIGANTAVFSLMDAVMLRSLPVRDPDRLVLFGEGEWMGITDGFPDSSWQLFSYPFYREVQHKNQVFSGVTAVQSLSLEEHGKVGNSADTEPIGLRMVSGTYFSVLGVNPILGRLFTDADDQTPGGHPVAVATYSWWRRRFGRDPSIIGRTLTIQSTVYTIIGVTPPEFFGTTVGESADLYIPLSMEEQVPPGWKGLSDKLFQSFYLIARLKPGVSKEQAGANVNLLFKQILHEYAGPQPSEKQLQNIQHAQIELSSAARGLSQLRIQFSTSLRVLMVVVGLVLLIACANIANLLLARATTRQREIAVRMAIGAGRSRLIRQLLTECVLLALLGGALGVAFAWWASQLLLWMVSGGPQPVPLQVEPDARVLHFTLALSLLTGVLFGTAPAFRATGLELTPSLKEGRGAVSAQSRSLLARALIASQVALSLVLLIGAGLFLRSLVNLTNVDTGFNKENVLIFGLDPASIGFKEDSRLARLYEQIEQHVSVLLGVRAAAFSMFAFNQGSWTSTVSAQGYASKSASDRVIMNNVVGPGFFVAMGLPALAGRTFGPQDTETSPKVAVINQTMAQRFFPGGSPIGRRFGLSDDPKHSSDIEVIGIVKDAKYERLQEDPGPMAYYPSPQRVTYLGNFEVRYSGDARSMIAEIRRAISDVNRDLPVADVTTMAELVDRSLVRHRLIAQLSTFFGLLAVFLACVGIYGVMSYAVARRTNEIGIRMALGAGRSTVLWLVMRDVLMLVGIGLAVGVPVAVGGDHWIASLLFGLNPTDPLTILAGIGLMLGVAALAGFLPARRATKIDPMAALRYE